MILKNDVDGHLSVKMALAQFAFKRFCCGFVTLGTVYGCRALHDGWVADSRSQVHLELMQRLFEQPLRWPAICYANGRHAVRGTPFRNIYEGVKDTRRIYV